MGKDKSFEEVLIELEDLVSKLENKEISLEDAVSTYKKGIDLINNCNEKLDKIEKEIKIVQEQIIW